MRKRNLHSLRQVIIGVVAASEPPTPSPILAVCVERVNINAMVSCMSGEGFIPLAEILGFGVATLDGATQQTFFIDGVDGEDRTVSEDDETTVQSRAGKIFVVVSVIRGAGSDKRVWDNVLAA